MKAIFIALSTTLILAACVPAKKYNDLVERERSCSEELEQYKSRAITGEGRAAEFEAKYNTLLTDVYKLKEDTMRIGNDYRMLSAQYNNMVNRMESLETTFDKYRVKGEQNTALLQADLDAKSIELQRKQDELSALEQELKSKQLLLADREQRVMELEEMIARQEKATKELRNKVANALSGFEDKGLTVSQKNGKIYVSLEAKLLFASGSTKVETEGKNALIQLAKVLEKETDLEIIVEGHTDTDRLASAAHPKNNWELSVLRATSVVEIMLGNSAMVPSKLMAAGRSEFLPVNPNDKAKNRRIEVIISPNLNELFDLIGH